MQYLWSKLSLEDYPNNQDLITVINAIDETKADKDELVQSNWNQADEQSLDFIKNKPFGEVLEKTNEMVWDGIITDDIEIITMSADDITLYAVRVSDFTPTIEQLSNVEIETTMVMDEKIVSNPIGEIRNITNDIVSDADGGILVVYKDEAPLEGGVVFPKAGLYCIGLDYLGTKQHYTSKVTFPFEFAESKIKTIEPKYLPKNIQSDWNQIDEQSLDFIKNKPFGEVTTTSNVLTWDGESSIDSICILCDEYKGETLHNMTYMTLVSELTPSKEELIGSKITLFCDGDSDIIILEEDGIWLNDDNTAASILDGEIAIIAYEDNATIYDVTFPKKGIYLANFFENGVLDDVPYSYQSYVNKFEIPNYYNFPDVSIKTIDIKYLPENYSQAVLFTEQILTEDQKIQARENIDAVGLIETNISVYNYTTTGKIEVYLENMICAEYMQHVTPEWILSINDFKFIDNQTNEEILFSETSDENLIIEQVSALDGMLIFADQMGVFTIFYVPTDNFPFIEGIVFPYQGAYLMDYLKLRSEGMTELKEIFSPIPLTDITIKKIDEQIVPDTISRVGHKHDVATTDTDGFMSASDKIKLDSLDSFVTKVILRQNSWNNNSKSTQIVINGIKEYNGYETIIDVYPVFDKTNIDTIREYNIYLSEQNSNVLTFVCDTMPSVDVMFYVKYENVKFVVHETELIDFEYIVNDDSTSTITGWKGTTYGVPDTKIIIPDEKYIII